MSSHGAWEYRLDIRDSDDDHLLTDDPLFSEVIDFLLDSTLERSYWQHVFGGGMSGQAEPLFSSWQWLIITTA